MRHKELREIVRRWRLARNETQKEIADRLGICLACVWRWEEGRNRPSRLTMRRIAEIFPDLHVMLSGSGRQRASKKT